MFRLPIQVRLIAWIALFAGIFDTGWALAAPPVIERTETVWEEFENRRLLECRFPGRDRHEPFDAEGRGRLVDLSDDLAEHAHLVVEVELRAESHDPAALRDLVYLHLLTGRLDQAVAEAQRWVSRFPTLEAWSALACAWYEQGVRTGQREKLLDALWALDQVPSEDSPSRQTLFNRALVASALPLPDLAHTLWQELRGLEADAGWREEVGDRLSRTQRPTIHEQWETDRDWVLAAVTGSDAELAESTTLRFLRPLEKYVERRLSEVELADRQLYLLADRLAEASTDMLLEHALKVWKDASEIDREDLLLGHQRYVEATLLQDESKVDQAFQAFWASTDALRRGGSPLYGRAEYAMARADFHLGRLDAARTRLEGLYEEAGLRSYPRLRAQVAWLLALIHGGQGRLDEQVALLLEARSLFVEARDAYGVASIDVLLAGAAHRQGRHAEAWDRFLQAGSYLVDHGEVRRLHVMWHELSESLLQTARLREAKYFIDELVINAETWAHPMARAEAWRLAAHVADAQGRRREAQHALEQAYSHALNFKGSGFSDRMAAALRVAEGEILVDREPARAIEELGTALESYRKTGYRFYLPRLFVARARAHANLGDPGGAAKDFEHAVEELETLLANTGEDADRVSLLRTSQRVFESAARFHLEIGDAKTALAYVERGRRLGSKPARFPGIDQVSPPGADEAYVVYALLVDRLVIFVWRRDGLHFLETGTRTREIEACLTSLRTAVARREPLTALEPLLEQLHGWLVAPVLPYLEDVQRLVLIAEGRLSETPFPLLRGRGQEVRLVERFVLAAAPSLSFLGDGNRSASAPEATSNAPLTVVNPRIDREAYPALPDLSWAQEELSTRLEDVAGGSVLHGEHATRDAVMEGMLRADRVWISAHLEADPADPFESVLVVAPDTSTGTSPSPGILRTEDIRRLSLGHLEWVVLATCRGAEVFREGREAVAGLSRAFLQAGSPYVIASIWSLNDEGSLSFSRHLRRALDQERDPVVALAESQIEALRSTDANTDDYAAWAGFRIMGRVR